MYTSKWTFVVVQNSKRLERAFYKYSSKRAFLSDELDISGYTYNKGVLSEDVTTLTTSDPDNTYSINR
ncbi:hypothetical protein [Siphonobacter sp. SORGH_AS_0500]|uniref:hypothetical protein n=1 Tax=Siphonobacter sp. SORGH_AS_0500 TaxID=1864824 RepID=UPI0012FF25C8|nr:hypothetical protein [Siphonobacter sp. SORGH_AS_0500]